MTHAHHVIDGSNVDVGVDCVVIEDSLDGREADLVAALDLGTSAVIISDRNTHRALGARVQRALDGRFSVFTIVLKDPTPDDVTADRIAAALPGNVDVLIAVGSGTINDLTKFVSDRQNIPYVVFATAPSMNGYTSYGASITFAGKKTSVGARTPRAVYFDLEVLCSAPARLIRAGIGDSVCRPTAQVDWLMSHLVLGTPYLERPFEMLAADETIVFEGVEGLLRGDREAMRALARLLVASGFGMTIAGGSYPASQGEHLLSHYAESMLPKSDTPPLHGEKVGVATLFMASLQERVLSMDLLPPLRPSSWKREDSLQHFGEGGDHQWEQFSRKALTDERADVINARLATEWPRHRERLLAVFKPVDELRDILAKIGAPTHHSELGWSDTEFARVCHHARFIRDRYTFLDLVADLGI